MIYTIYNSLKLIIINISLNFSIYFKFFLKELITDAPEKSKVSHKLTICILKYIDSFQSFLFFIATSQGLDMLDFPDGPSIVRTVDV